MLIFLNNTGYAVEKRGYWQFFLYDTDYTPAEEQRNSVGIERPYTGLFYQKLMYTSGLKMSLLHTTAREIALCSVGEETGVQCTGSEHRLFPTAELTDTPMSTDWTCTRTWWKSGWSHLMWLIVPLNRMIVSRSHVHIAIRTQNLWWQAL